MKAKTKILVLEHNANDIDLIQHELKKGKINYVAEIVQTGKDYENALLNFVPDIILSDYTLPTFDGPTAFKIKEKLCPDTPFIFVSGTIGEENSIEFIKKGVTDFALKDKLFTLAIKVNRALKEAKEKKEKSQAAQALLQSEAGLSRAQQIAHIGSWELDLATNVSIWSDEACRIYGLAPGENKQSRESFLSFIHPDDFGSVLTTLTDSMASLRDSSIYYRIIRKDGAIRYMHSESRFELDTEGKPTGLHGISHDITEIKEIEEELHKSETSLRAIFENTDVGFILMDTAYNILAANYMSEQWSKSMFMVPLVKGVNLRAKLLPEKLNQFDQMMTVVKEGGQINYEADYPDLDGIRKWFHVNGKPVVEKGGEVTGICLAVSNITERKLAEQELKIVNDRLVFHMENSPLGFIEWDGQLRVKSLSKQAEQIFGWSEEEYIEGERNGYSQVFEGDLPAVDKMMGQFLSGEIVSGSLQNRNYTKDGRLIWCEWFTTVMKDKDGKVDTLLSLVQDITARKETENKISELNEKLKEANYELKTVLNTLPANIVLVDKTGKIQMVNESWNQFVASNNKQSKPYGLGEQYCDVCEKTTGADEQSAKKMTTAVSRIIAGNLKNFELEYPCNWQGEKCWFKVEAKPLIDGKLSGAVVIHINISREKLAEIEIMGLNTNLEERVHERTAELSEANKALEAFSFSVSHDLRAPVRAVTSFTKIIQQEYGAKMEPEMKELFGYIDDSGKRMIAIIDDLLKLAKYGTEKLKLEPVNMTRLVNGVWLNISRTTPHKAVLELAELKEVNVDMSMMQQVIVNLLSNAIKYSSKIYQPVVSVWSEQTTDNITFYFKDNGAGFDMKNYDRLFSAFQRLHNARDFEGTGVGLTLVKRIIEKHGGTIGAEGKVNEGATFWFTIPIEKDGAKA